MKALLFFSFYKSLSTSLSPRPEILIMAKSSLSFRILIANATACEDSIAGIIPSNLDNNLKNPEDLEKLL